GRGMDLEFERSDAGRSPVAAASRNLPVVASFLALSGIHFARIEPGASGRIALWSDIRWCSKASCDVSFGGAFHNAMPPLYQIVQIGEFRQMRSIPAPTAPK